MREGEDIMSFSYYTIDQVARLLEMHHKTIRKFISDGRLPAHKVGKQWRISGHDLSVFVERGQQANLIGGLTAETMKDKSETDAAAGSSNADNARFSPPVSVSAVVDINRIKPEGYSRISSMLTAVMNSGDPGFRGSAVNMKYYSGEQKMRIMLWGGIKYITGALESVAVITETGE